MQARNDRAALVAVNLGPTANVQTEDAARSAGLCAADCVGLPDQTGTLATQEVRPM